MRVFTWIGVSVAILALAIVSAAIAGPPRPQEADVPPPGAASQFSTDFSKHSVPYNEILSGGPPKDGIPAVDAPQYISVDEADEWLEDREPVVAVEANGEARAYPIQILMWHEITNDTLGGFPVTVTYCPLCNTGIAFAREFDGQVLDFGTTGRLRNSNLIMYDRQTETWWQQATGEGIAGEYTGEMLALYPAPLVAWADFKAAHPDGTVISRDTGFTRDYGRNPYVAYDNEDNTPFLFSGETPEILPAMARVATVELDGDTVAYPYEVLQEIGVVNDTVADTPVVVMWDAGTASALDSGTIAHGADVGSVNTFSRVLDGDTLTFAVDGDSIVDEQAGSQWNILGEAVSGPSAGRRLEPIVNINHFWFSWVAFRPQTRVYEPPIADTPDAEAAALRGSSLEPVEVANLKADFDIGLYQGREVLGDAESVRFSDAFAQGKPVIAVMWAGVCPLCRVELPELETVYQEHMDDLVVIGVDIGPFVRLGTQEDGKALLNELGVTFPAGSTEDAGILPAYGVLGTPSTYFFKPDGEILEKWAGRLTRDQLDGLVKELIETAREG
jgi:thiol-disulfide isomerase/thioredoxin